MIIEELKKRNDLERIGKYYFKLGMKDTLNKSFESACVNFKKGLDYLTCDCIKDKWIIEYGYWDKGLFNDLDYSLDDPSSYCFVKAFLLSYLKDKKNRYLALDSIEKYLEIHTDYYGLYVKGKILNKLGDYVGAYKYYLKSLEIKKSSLIIYSLGRLDAKTFEFGIQDVNGYNYNIEKLFKAFLLNPSSLCCASKLKENWIIEGYYQGLMKHEIKNKTFYDYSKNKLVKAFISKNNTNEFINLYKSFLDKEEILHIDDMEKGDNHLAYFVRLLKRIEFLDSIDANIDSKGNFIENDNELFGKEEDDYSFNDTYYNDSLDLDQQDPEFWDSL
ncbi:hypothetical protein [Hanstruepera marina]|uniref:hypothetical protein n=1 Tax=Hanstruepera marina TaxID=2873265 RepID=UPI001CA6BC52|nr:hypothetical protein [Hanstruepera marina]